MAHGSERAVETSLDYCNAVVVISLIIIDADTTSHVHI